MFKDLIYSQNIDEIHTSDAYFGQIIIVDNNLLIPYINLGISNHELNKSSDLKFIDYCYFVAIDIYYLKINGNIIFDLNGVYNSSRSIYLGGDDLLKKQNVYEVEIQAKDAFLKLESDSKIYHKNWVPINTPNFEKNMNDNRVQVFINNMNLPQDLALIFKNCEENSIKK